MKNITLILSLVFPLFMQGQILDGMTQPTDFRILSGFSKTESVTDNSFLAYRQKINNRVSVTGIASYSFEKDEVLPQVWIEYNIKRILWFKWQTSTKWTTLSSTLLLNSKTAISGTWSGIGKFKEEDVWLNRDRAQVVIERNEKRFAINAGYSFLDHSGVILNARVKITPLTWIQTRYDFGTETVSLQTLIHFDR